MLAKILIAFGLTFRSVCLLFGSITIFIIGSMLTLILADNHYYIQWALILTPLIIIDIIFARAILSRANRNEFNISEQKNKKINHHSNSLKVAMACHGVYVSIGIIILSLIVAFDCTEYGPKIFVGYVFVGWIVVYKIMWPYFKKNMK